MSFLELKMQAFSESFLYFYSVILNKTMSAHQCKTCHQC